MARFLSNSKAFPIICLLIFVALSCRERRTHLSPYPWETTRPRFDSLSREAELLLLDDTHDARIRDMLNEMDSLISVHDKVKDYDRPSLRAMQARLAFLRCIDAEQYGNVSDSLVKRMIDATLALDSTLFPYHFHRLRGMQIKYLSFRGSPDIRPFLASVDFYEEIGDFRMQANSLIAIGNLMALANQYVLAYKQYVQADSIYRINGIKYNRWKNRVNIAYALTKLGRSPEALNILQSILEDSLTIRDLNVQFSALSQLYDLSGDTKYIIRLYDVVKDKNEEMATVCRAKLAYHYLINADSKAAVDTAAAYLNNISPYLDKILNSDNKKTVLRALSLLYEHRGQPDSAYIMLKRYEEEEEKTQSAIHSEQIVANHYFHDISMLQYAKESAEQRNRHIVWLCGMALVILMFGSAVLLMRNKKNKLIEIERYKNSQIKAELEALQHRREVMALTLANEESSKRISRLKDNLESLASSGNIDDIQLRDMRSNLLELTQAKSEWKQVIEIVKSTHPNFIPNLYAISPTITPAQIRLASLTLMGLSIKQISSYLNVKPESVMQSRSRIKTKLGIPDNESLESALVRINGKTQ